MSVNESIQFIIQILKWINTSEDLNINEIVSAGNKDILWTHAVNKVNKGWNVEAYLIGTRLTSIVYSVKWEKNGERINNDQEASNT